MGREGEKRGFDRKVRLPLPWRRIFCYAAKDKRRETEYGETHCKDVLLLGRRAEAAVEADLPVVQDLMDTLRAHTGHCVGLAGQYDRRQ